MGLGGFRITESGGGAQGLLCGERGVRAGPGYLDAVNPTAAGVDGVRGGARLQCSDRGRLSLGKCLGGQDRVAPMTCVDADADAQSGNAEACVRRKSQKAVREESIRVSDDEYVATLGDAKPQSVHKFRETPFPDSIIPWRVLAVTADHQLAPSNVIHTPRLCWSTCCHLEPDSSPWALRPSPISTLHFHANVCVLLT